MNHAPISDSEEPPKARLLLVDGSAERPGLEALLADAGFVVDFAATFADAFERLATSRPDLLLAEAGTNGLDGVALTLCARELDPTIGVVVLAEADAGRDAVEALRAGADHYVTRPVDAVELGVVLARAVAQCALRRELAVLRERAGVTAVVAANADIAPTVPGARLEDIERHAILSTLDACEGSTQRAASVLGVSVRMIQYRLREYRYGIRRDYGSDHRAASEAGEQGRRLEG
jgi:DNA-binding NtrC family response regulator